MTDWSDPLLGQRECSRGRRSAECQMTTPVYETSGHWRTDGLRQQEA